MFKSMFEKPSRIKIKVEEEPEGACVKEGLAKQGPFFGLFYSGLVQPQC